MPAGNPDGYKKPKPVDHGKIKTPGIRASQTQRDLLAELQKRRKKKKAKK